MIARAATLAPLAALLLAGCAEEFVPASVLDDLRVLAVAPTPTEVGPGETVTAVATVHRPPSLLPGGAPPDPVKTETWTFCPLTTGAATGYRCIDPRCEFEETGVELDAAGRARVTVDPAARGLECLARLGGSLPSDPGQTELPAVVETVLRYRVVIAPAGGAEQVREAVARIPLHRTAPAAPNRPPALTSLRVGGQEVWNAADPGAPVELAGALPRTPLPVVADVDPSRIDTYVEAGRTLTESVVVEVFATAGRFDEDRGSPPRATFALEELGGAPGSLQLYVVARDLRGGQLAAGPYTVRLAAP